MKTTRIIILTATIIGALNFTTSAQTLSSVIGETISFLQNKTVQVNTLRTAVIEFSITDNLTDFGTISGRASLIVDSAEQKIGTKGIKQFFLRSAGALWVSTNGVASNKTFAFTTPFLAAVPSTLSITSNKGTATNNVPYNLPAIKTINSSSNGANEYIISGFLDSSNPKKYITIRITMLFSYFG
jgi:hypothetical protein